MSASNIHFLKAVKSLKILLLQGGFDSREKGKIIIMPIYISHIYQVPATY